MIRKNRFLTKLLNKRHMILDDRDALSFEQIEWRMENTSNVLGFFGTRPFKENITIILIRADDGTYRLFVPNEEDVQIPDCLYDIADIDVFLKNVNIAKFDFINNEIEKDLREKINLIRNYVARGIIDTFNDKLIAYDFLR